MQKPRGANIVRQIVDVPKHDLQEGKWVPFGVWEV